MGQTMDVMNFYIKIRRDNIENAKKSIIRLLDSLNFNSIITHRLSSYEAKKKDFYEIMEHFGWIFDDCVLNEKEQYICLDCFEGDSFCSDDILFTVLAPYIEQDGYVDFCLEMQHYYSWSFKDGKLLEAIGEIKYSEYKELEIDLDMKLKPGYKWDKGKSKIVETKDE